MKKTSLKLNSERLKTLVPAEKQQVIGGTLPSAQTAGPCRDSCAATSED